VHSPEIASPPRKGLTASRFSADVVHIFVHGDPIAALSLVWLVMAAVQFATPNVIGIDGYYHIKFAWLIRHLGVRIDFPWLPLTLLNPRDFTDHHLLYHLLLVPFTLLDLREGAKLAALLFSVAAVSSAYLLLASLRVRYRLLWLLALLGSSDWFLVRESMTRRQSVSLLLLILAVYAMLFGRTRWLLPLAFAYAWLFDGFVLLIAVVGLWFAAGALAERRLDWPVVVRTGGGLALALLANPYFPNNLWFTIQHVFPKIVPESRVNVGTEWYPYPIPILLQSSWLALLFLVAGLIPLITSAAAIRRDRRAIFLAALALLSGALYLRARRFIELEPAFAVLFCAYVWSAYCPAGLQRWWCRLSPTTRFCAVAGLLLALTLQGGAVISKARIDAMAGRDYTTFQDASVWLMEHTEPGERVYQTDWDNFPELFYFNTYNTYIVGLDPTFMYLANPELYLLWRSIGRGQVEHPSEPIRELFQAQWVITDRTHVEFLTKAARDPAMVIVFEAPAAIVFQVSGV